MARRSADARTKPDGRLAEKILEGDFQRVERESCGIHLLGNEADLNYLISALRQYIKHWRRSWSLSGFGGA